MAGIYIHIPFCRKKCSYCNFFSLATSRYRQEFTEALLMEMDDQKDYLSGEVINTVYLGGGTPSMLRADELYRIFERLNRHFQISPDAEITLEANPDDLTASKARELSGSPVNRLSIGVQSFFDDDLVYLDRVHDSEQAKRSIINAKESGFNNLSIDLIYGIPTLTMEKWIRNLELFFSFDIPHLSAYSLTVEDRTPLKLLIERKKKEPVPEDDPVEQFRLLLELTRGRDYIHYEISNFSLEGYYSKHNSLYWLGGHYLGLGPSAHSFNGYSRQWNASNLGRYIHRDASPETKGEREILTPSQRYNEYVMTSLRTVWGCDAEHIKNVFGGTKASHFENQAAKLIATGNLVRNGSIYRLTDDGKLFADGIAASLFVEEDTPGS